MTQICGELRLFIEYCIVAYLETCLVFLQQPGKIN